jgi:hypothetical protein
MPITRYGIHRLLKIFVFTLVIAIVVGYTLFATHDFMSGPSISVSEPANGSTFYTPDIHIKGRVFRIQDISLNGRSITIDNQGNFDEVVLLAPGYNIFNLVARDKFGRSKDYRLELVYAVN